MNKIVEMAAIVVSAGVMLGIAGCGGPESEYKDLLDKAVKLEMMDKSQVNKSLEDFKKYSPEKQQEEIKQARAWTAAAEAAKKAAN